MVQPDWGSLERSIDGEVTLPGSPAFEAARTTFNARFHQVEPMAVVSCTTANDASAALSFANRLGLEIAVRCGGHSFAGHSSTRGVLIDVSPMRSVSVSGEVVTVGAGARLGRVYEALDADGLAIPAGTCPSVGVAGLTLGGGLGILGRSHGVTSDSLIAAEVVLADGRVVECDEHHDRDLFWALRGAGAGSFGVVTALVFRAIPAPEATNIHLSWSASDAAAAIAAWQTWAPSAPDEIAASLKPTTTGDVATPPSLDLYVAAFGMGSDPASAVLDGLVVRVGSDPSSSSAEHLSFPDTRRFWARLGEAEEAAPQPVYLCARSEFFGRPLPPEAIEALIDASSRERAEGESRELDFMPWGGAYNRVRPDATAFVHRDERFQLKHSATVDPDASAESKDAALRHVSRSLEAVHPWGSGRVFQNFADPDLDDWAEAHYGTNLERLVQIKRRYDPTNVFRGEQSLGSI